MKRIRTGGHTFEFASEVTFVFLNPEFQRRPYSQLNTPHKPSLANMLHEESRWAGD